MAAAGHSRDSVFRNHYQANNSGADVQGPYFFKTKRDLPNELLRSADIEYVENLEQELPAQVVSLFHTLFLSQNATPTPAPIHLKPSHCILLMLFANNSDAMSADDRKSWLFFWNDLLLKRQ